MKIILEGKPMSTNSIYRNHGHIMFMTKEGKALKTSYQYQALSQREGNKPWAGNIVIDIKLYFGDKRRHDIDNYNKILLDAMTGILWEDDSQIVKMTIWKLYDKEKPRIEIEI